MKKKLEFEAENNKFIRAFLKEIARSRQKEKSHKKKKYTYKMIMSLIEKNERVYSFTARGLTEKDLIKLANNLKIEQNKQKIIKYLNLFQFIKFPLEWEILYNFLELNNKEINTLVIRALKFFKGKKIRELAISKLTSRILEDEYLRLLTENYLKGDSELLTKLLKVTRNIHKFHEFGGSILSIYEKNKTKECLEPLEIFYDKGFCSLCRKNAIEIMIENKVLSEYIKKEALFDSNIEIRELIKNCN